MEDLNEHVSVDMIADPVGDSPSLSVPADAEAHDAFEEWNDILADAGLCGRPKPTWEDAWSDVSEPVAPASPSSKVTGRPFRLVVATPKAPAQPLPKAKCDKLTSEVIRLQNELHAAHKRCARLDQSKQRYEKESRELRDLSNDLRAQLDDAARREAALQSDVTRAREEAADAKKQLVLEQKRAEDRERARSAAQSYADTLHTQLQHRSVALAACAEKMRQDKETNAQLVAHATFFQKQALRLRGELDAQRPPLPPPPRTFPVVRLRTQPLARPAPGESVPMSSWGPGEYVKQLKRQEYAHRVHMQRLHEQAEGAVKKLRAELGTVVAQRDELKAEADRLYTEVAALKRDAKAVRKEEGEEVRGVRDELVAAVVQRDELMDEVVMLHAENATLIQDALDAEAAKVAAQDELARLRGDPERTSQSSTTTALSTGASTNSDTVPVDAAHGELIALRQSIDNAYAPLGPVMAERLAVRGIVLQREPRHEEKVALISDFALYLVAAGASSPEPTPPSVSSVSTSDERDPATRPPEVATTVAAAEPTRSEKAPLASRPKRSAAKSSPDIAKPAASSTIPAEGTDRAETAPSTPKPERPATKSPPKAKTAKANPRKEPAPATSPPSTTQPSATPDAHRSPASSIRSSAADLAAYAASLIQSQQLADAPTPSAPKMVAKSKALAQLRLLGDSSSPMLKDTFSTSASTPRAELPYPLKDEAKAKQVRIVAVVAS